jgi:hypothetical protein
LKAATNDVRPDQMFAANSMAGESRDPRKRRMHLFFQAFWKRSCVKTGSVAKSRGVITETCLNFLHLDDKLMDLPNDFAVRSLLLEKSCDLERQFGEKYQLSHRSMRERLRLQHSRFLW